MKPRLLFLLKICIAFIFLGRAYQFLFIDAPLRALFWDESLLSPIVEGIFNTPWNEYASSLKVTQAIQYFIKAIGVIFALAGIAVFFLRKNSPIILNALMWVAWAGLLLLAISIFKSKNYLFLEFLELSLQLATPALLILYVTQKINYQKLILGLKIAVAATFLPHGLFAMGVPFIPGHFIDMTISILGCTQSQAELFLLIAGILDAVVAIGIFIPKIERYCLLYAVFWGLTTAFARIWAGFNVDFIALSLHLNLNQTVYRLVHGIVPLIIYLSSRKKANF